jgi:hypothetical protein
LDPDLCCRFGEAANKLIFCQSVSNLEAWLVNIYFLDDRGYKPTSRDEWTPALAKVKAELGIAALGVPYSGDVFLPAFDA